MRLTKKRSFAVLLLLGLLLALGATTVMAAEGEGYQSNMYATFWALVPPIVAIVLALVTKEVYISLFVGIVAGGLFYANFHPGRAVVAITQVMIEKVGDSWNAGILIFLVMLGIIVALMNKAGGSAAYGAWASRRIKSKEGSLLATVALGIIIFVDDYFNCLTVGSVMQPVTDKFRVSRAKLSYIIDATAAPVCIIAPISSWAAAVTSSTTGDVDGFALFIRAIPYNFYALLTILFMVAITLMKFDFGPMKKYEDMAEKGDLFGGTGDEYGGTAEVNTKGKVYDLILPILVLIASCIICMVYTGGFFDGVPFVQAFADCDPSVGLPLGALIALIFVFLLYIPRKVITFRQFADSLPEGFRQMVPALLILTFAWTLGGFCSDYLGAGEFVGGVMEGSAAANALLPAIMFLVSLGLAFATGTSWGTFAILIPIAQAVFPGAMTTILVITISAVLAGAVCGDHISPISDTTIMASTGARVNHIIHVSSQMPYALTVAAISFVCFLLAGIIQSAWIVLPIGIVLTLGTLFILKRFAVKNA